MTNKTSTSEACVEHRMSHNDLKVEQWIFQITVLHESGCAQPNSWKTLIGTRNIQTRTPPNPEMEKN